MDIARTPPHSVDIERALAGSAILGGIPVCREVRAIAPPEALWHTPSRLIYTAALRLAQRDVTPDIVTVRDELTRGHKLAEAGGLDEIRAVIESCPTTSTARHHAERVREHWATRQIMFACSEIAAKGYDLNGTSGMVFAAEAARRIGDIATNAPMSRVVEWVDHLHAAFDPKRKPEACEFRLIREVHDTLGNIWAGSLVVVCGRPGHGKSTLMRTLARDLAERGRVLYHPIEEGADGATCSMLAHASRMPKKAVRLGARNDHDARRLHDAASSIMDLHLDIDDHPEPDVDHIHAAALAAHRRSPLAAVVIDYLSIMKHRRVKGDTLAQAIGDTTRRLKVLARELRVPVIVGAQINRESEKGGWKASKPKAHQLKDSGSIEQDADQVWGVWSREKAQQDDVPLWARHIVEVSVLKDRWSDSAGAVAVALTDGACLRDGSGGDADRAAIEAYRHGAEVRVRERADDSVQSSDYEVRRWPG
jgi:replicative DNA helicase